MTKQFNSLDEIQKYYDEKSNTYIFMENGRYIDTIVFTFDLDVGANIEAANIKARNIRARNIEAEDIEAWNIGAWDINAQDINYYAMCFAYNNIKCKSIKGKIEDAKHFVLDGTLEVIE